MAGADLDRAERLALGFGQIIVQCHGVAELRVGAFRRRFDRIEKRVRGRPLEIVLVGVPAEAVVWIADPPAVLDDVRIDVNGVLNRMPRLLAVDGSSSPNSLAKATYCFGVKFWFRSTTAPCSASADFRFSMAAGAASLASIPETSAPGRLGRIGRTSMCDWVMMRFRFEVSRMVGVFLVGLNPACVAGNGRFALMPSAVGEIGLGVISVG